MKGSNKTVRGIYKITNIKSNKVYIGETMDIRRRWKEHIDNLDNNIHHSYKLQQDWNKYGADCFEFKILSVLDESVTNYIDKYILMIYEEKYISKYNSIATGYNVEHTIEKVLNGDKTIFNRKKDEAMLKQYIDKIDNDMIIDYGGLIYVIDIFTLKDLEKELKMDNKKLRKLMLQERIIYKDDKKYILADDYKNNTDIFLDDNSSIGKMKLNLEGYKLLYDKLKDKEILKKKANNNPSGIKHAYMEKQKNDISFKDFLYGYKLNVKYNDIFSFLRTEGIFEYVARQDNKRENRPTEKYNKWFSLKETKINTGLTYNKIYINEIGVKEIYKLLHDNKYISDK